MDFLVEFFGMIAEIFGEALWEGYLSIIKDRKISRWIRYPLIALGMFLVAGIIGFVGYHIIAAVQSGALTVESFVKFLLAVLGVAVVIGIPLWLLGRYWKRKRELKRKKQKDKKQNARYRGPEL